MRPESAIHWKAYPAMLCATALALGIGGAAAVPSIAFWQWMAAAGAGVLLAAAGFLWARRRLVTPGPLVWTLAAGLALAGAGGARATLGALLPAGHIAHVVAAFPDEGAEVVLEGRIDRPPLRSRRATRFRLDARRLFAPSDTARANPIPVSGSVQVALRPSAWEQPARPFPPVAQGDRVRLRATLRPPPAPRNPADFDYGTFLRRRGIYATAAVYEPEKVAVTGRQRSLLERVVTPARHYVGRQLARQVPSRRARAVLRALLLGDRSRIDDATEEHFARSGLMHLLAVSGLHVLLVGWLFYQLLRPLLLRLGLRRRWAEALRAGLTLAVLVFYVLLAGAPASATRAVVMAGLLMGGVLLQRSAHPLNTLGVAAAGLLLWRPAQLFEAGFQLSFAAVGAIVTLGPVLRRNVPQRWREGRLRRAVLTSTVTTTAATLGTLPVLLLHFGRAPFAGLLLNLWAIPLMAVALTSGLAAVALGGWAAPLAASFGAAADLFVHALLWTAAAGEAYLPWTVLHVAEAEPWLLAALVAALFLLAQAPRPRLRWRLACLTVALLAAGCWQGALRKRAEAPLDALFFDVGHGDAALLTLPGGRHVLVDGGGRTPFSDAAASVVLPHLERHGIDRLDAVLLSHPDGDHLGGLPTLLRSVPVARFISSGDTAASDLFGETRHLLDSLRIPRCTVRAGDTLRLGPRVHAQVLAPTRRLVETASENDASLVFRLAYRKTRFLFTGDAEQKAEAQLVQHYGTLLASDVVKVGHHGSKTSSTPAFVRRAVGAKAPFAVVSSGRRFGLPNAAVVQRWRRAGATALVTARTGAVWLRSDGQAVWRVRWR